MPQMVGCKGKESLSRIGRLASGLGSVKATAENNLPQFPSPGSTTRLRTHGGESVNSILNEYGVLGSLLIDPSLFPEAAELPDDMFSSVPLQEIFRAMRHQYEESGALMR